MAVVAKAFDGRFFDGAVHAHHQAIRSWMVGLGQAVFEVVLRPDLIEAEDPVAGFLALMVLGLILVHSSSRRDQNYP